MFSVPLKQLARDPAIALDDYAARCSGRGNPSTARFCTFAPTPFFIILIAAHHRLALFLWLIRCNVGIGYHRWITSAARTDQTLEVPNPCRQRHVRSLGLECESNRGAERPGRSNRLHGDAKLHALPAKHYTPMSMTAILASEGSAATPTPRPNTTSGKRRSNLQMACCLNVVFRYVDETEAMGSTTEGDAGKREGCEIE